MRRLVIGTFEGGTEPAIDRWLHHTGEALNKA